MKQCLKERVESALAKAKAVSAKASPSPWEASDTGYISDSEGFVVCHLTARRGAKRWDWEKNPNAAFIAESRALLPEVARLLEEILEQLED